MSHVLQILLLGIETHVCVFQTAVDLLEDGYEVHLVVDGVSSKRLADRAVAIEVEQPSLSQSLHSTLRCCSGILMPLSAFVMSLYLMASTNSHAGCRMAMRRLRQC